MSIQLTHAVRDPAVQEESASHCCRGSCCPHLHTWAHGQGLGAQAGPAGPGSAASPASQKPSSSNFSSFFISPLISSFRTASKGFEPPAQPCPNTPWERQYLLSQGIAMELCKENWVPLPAPPLLPGSGSPSVPQFPHFWWMTINSFSVNNPLCGSLTAWKSTKNQHSFPKQNVVFYFLSWSERKFGPLKGGGWHFEAQKLKHVFICEKNTFFFFQSP